MHETAQPPELQRGGLPSASPEALAALVSGVRRLAMQRDLLGMATVAAETAAELGEGLRARCYLFHAEESLLWTEEGDEFPAASGLAGFSARSRETRVAPRADRDPDYCRQIDDPDGSGAERLLAQPIFTPSGETHAVVVVARSASLPEFSSSDIALLAFWAAQAAPLFHMLHVEGLVEQTSSDVGIAGGRKVYREEALERLVAGDDDFAVLLDRMPWWLRQSHLLVVAVAVVAALFFLLVPVKDYTSGPAFVVADPNDVAAAGTTSADEAPPLLVRALVPGRYRARIHAGQPFLFEIEGASKTTHGFTVTSVSEQELGAGGLRRAAGPALADRAAIDGPMIIVEARPFAPSVAGDGRVSPLREGIVGRAQIVVGRKPIIYLLFPELEEMLSDGE